MATKKSSLLETLKELENPASSVLFNDPEDEDDTLTTIHRKELTNLNSEVDNADFSKSFGNLRKKTFHDDDPKYKGNKISRKSLEDWDEEKLDDSGEDDDAEEDESDEDITGDELEVKNGQKLDHSNGENNGNSDTDVDEQGESLEDGDYSDNEMIIDSSMIPKDLQRSQENDDEDNVEDFSEFNNFSKNANDEVQKGKATKSQLDLLDKLLDSRIRLQKSLQVTNRLPQHDMLKEFKQRGGVQLNQAYVLAKTSIIGLLDKLLSLQQILLESNPDTVSVLTNSSLEKHKQIDDDEEILSDSDDENKEDKGETEEASSNTLNLPTKRKHTLTVADYEEEISKRHKSLLAYRDSTISKWYEKTRLSSGKINSKNFTAFDKSTLQQIKQVMVDKDRLIKRTQLKRTPFNILGKRSTVINEETEDVHLKDYDENIFDDGDFYHEMLKELIERKTNITSDDPVAVGRQWLELQKLRTKIKRKIDTRASKGRRVRYDVHSKLISFMAPQNAGMMSDQARNDLFSSLFGGGAMLPAR